MRPPLRLGLALGGLVLLGVIATVAGERRSSVPEADPRRSTLVFGPDGASAWAEALLRLGVDVERSRNPRFPALDTVVPGTLLASLDPARPLGPFDGARFAAHVEQGGHVLLAGPPAGAAMACFGYEVRTRVTDSLRAVSPDPRMAGALWVRAGLVPTGRTHVADTVEAVSGVIAECRVPPVARVDTLLASGLGPVALRLHAESGGTALLVADGTLFSNRRLRRSEAGELTLALVAGRYDRVVVDEYHHGFGAGGSLARTVLAWSAASPWGWAVWQLVLVGALAVLAGAVRFGPPRALDEGRRRSPLEHVRALAAALAAARGHDVAIRLLVSGLRRRLGRAGTTQRGDPAEWLAGIAPHLRTPRAQSAAATLTALTTSPQPASGVLEAANAVEDLWEELRP